MKRIDRWLSGLLTVCMLLSLLPMSAFAGGEIVASGSCGDNVTWTRDADGVLIISGTGKVYPDAFENDDTIKKVVVEPGVTGIGNYAFAHCDSMTSVVLPEGVTSIGNSSFSECYMLTSVILPEGLISIGDWAFFGSDHLITVNIPKSVTNIGEFAFRYCDGLQGIWVDPENEYYSSDKAGVLFDKHKTTLIRAPETITGIYSAPEGLTCIEDTAFQRCEDLTGVTLPEGLTQIGNNAFDNCVSLTSVTLPEGLRSIEYHAFYGCVDLDCLIFLGDVPTIASNAFYSSQPTVYYPAGNPSWTDEVMQKYGGSPQYRGLGEPEKLSAVFMDPYYLVGEIVEKDRVTVELKYDSGAWSWMPGGLFELEVEDMTSSGVKSVTVSSGGFQTQTQIFVHKGGRIEPDPETWPESAHNYPNDSDETQVLTIPGAQVIKVTFSPQTTVESRNDHIFVYDDTDAELAKFTHTSAAGKTVTVQGDTVKIRLLSNGSVDDWGYSLSCVEAFWVEHEEQTVESVEPTCTQMGRTEGLVCVVCGLSRGVSDIPALGHSWQAADCTTPLTCTTCGSTSGDALGHNWTVADCDDPRTCVHCGETDGDPIGHHYLVTTGICTVCGGRSPFEVVGPEMEYCYSTKQTSVRAQWTKVEGVDGYELYRSTDPDDHSSFQLVKTIHDPTITTYTNQSLTEGVTYYYRVCSFVLLEDGKTRVRSPLSNAKHIPAAVVWDAPYSNSSFRVRLRWNEVGGAHGYQIWICEEGGAYRVVKTVKQGDVAAYSNVSLIAGAKYTYKMRAYHIGDDGSKTYGPYSDEVTVAVQPEAPTFAVTSPKAGRAQISWESASGAAGYQIWMSESASGDFRIAKSIYDGNTTSYTKSSLESGKTYYFKLRSFVEVDGKKTFGAYTEIIEVKIE